MLNEDKPQYPMRINKFLHMKGFCSRRKADELVERGLVKINGALAVLGQKVLETDKIELGEEIFDLPKNYEYHLFYKPRGVVSHSPKPGEKSLEDFFNHRTDLHAVGRLDKDSEGLMLITNDGRIVEKMLDPKYDHEKEYIVKVDLPLKESFARKMEKGVKIEGYMTAPCTVRVKSDRTFSIVLTEGKKHQIRRMCAALGLQVQDLKRTRIGVLKLGGLYPGQQRPIRMDEKVELLKGIGLM